MMNRQERELLQGEINFEYIRHQSHIKQANHIEIGKSNNHSYNRGKVRCRRK